jgi:hypothetical protein
MARSFAGDRDIDYVGFKPEIEKRPHHSSMDNAVVHGSGDGDPAQQQALFVDM